MRVAVVGHIEHVEFLRVARVPSAGAIVHASETWDEAAGGGGVACVQLAKLARACTLFTALGDDARGRAVPAMLAARAAEGNATVDVRVAWRKHELQRRALVFVDDAAERTITVIGKRHQPEQVDLEQLARSDDAFDAAYFTAGAPEVLRALRERARVVVATSRVLPTLEAASRLGVQLDAIVRSAHDLGEPDPTPSIERGALRAPRLVIATEGAAGGAYVERAQDGDVVRRGRWAAAPLPAPAVDAYGCGDSFAAGLTFALGANMSTADALAFAARCGAACLTGRGPFAGQLVAGADFGV